MSTPLPSIDPGALAAVTGGKNSAGTLDTLLDQLSSITGSLKDIHRKTSGLNSTEMLMLCVLAMQNRGAGSGVVYVGNGRSGCWW